MALAIGVELRGAMEAADKSRELARFRGGGPMVRAMDRALILAAATAKRLAKVDTGDYRASISTRIEFQPTPQGGAVVGVLGSNRRHAPFVVLDTRPHWPPMAPILAWVKRKKIAGRYSIKTRRRVGKPKDIEAEDRAVAFLVARAISRRGTKGDQSLIRGVTDNRAAIERLLGGAVDVALQSWGE